MIPRRLAISVHSPFYDALALRAVDKVFVDGMHIPNCVAYDMDAGWALGKGTRDSWLPRRHGVVTVTER